MLLGEREMMRHNMLYIKPNLKHFEIHNQKLNPVHVRVIFVLATYNVKLHFIY